MENEVFLLTILSSSLWLVAVVLACRWITPAWDGMARRYVARIMPRLRDLGMERDVDTYMRWWGILMIVTLVFFGVLLSMIPVALALIYVVFISPPHVLNYMLMKRQILLRDQMVSGSVALANATRAGLSFVQSLESIVGEMPQPLSGEFRRIVKEYHAGRPLADVIQDTQRRLNIEAFTVFASTILVCMERGGRVTYALERISSSLQELQRLERKLDADTASGRLLTITLGAFPAVFLVGFTLLDPVTMGCLYNTILGQLVLVAVGVMVFVALRWCAKILRIEF